MDLPTKWQIDWENVPLARARPVEPQSPPDSPEETEAAPDQRRGRLSPTVSAIVAATVGIGSVAGLALSLGDKEAGTPAKGPSSRSAGRLGIVRPANSAFVASGVRFLVVPSPNQAWTRATTALIPGAGFRWQTVAVLYRNLTRHHVTAEQLRLRLQDAQGRVYLPDPGVGNAGTELRPRAEMPAGRLVHGQLAFRVRTNARQLTFLINPTPRTRVRVSVASR
jgi:hypothetical protein